MKLYRLYFIILICSASLHCMEDDNNKNDTIPTQINTMRVTNPPKKNDSPFFSNAKNNIPSYVIDSAKKTGYYGTMALVTYGLWKLSTKAKNEKLQFVLFMASGITGVGTIMELMDECDWDE